MGCPHCSLGFRLALSRLQSRQVCSCLDFRIMVLWRTPMKRLPRLFVLAFVVLTFATPFSNAQTFSVLYNFGSAANDPSKPSYPGIVTQGSDGNLYSTAPAGGANGCGAV